MPDVDNDAAAEGTFLHEVTALCLLQGRPAKHFLGHTDIVHVFDAGHADAVQEALDYVAAIPTPVFSRFVEERVASTSCPEVWGTLDVALYVSPHRGDHILHVIDFKFGGGVFVPAKDNAQLLSYALAFLESHLELAPDEVRLHIVQPRHHRKDELEPVVLTPEDVGCWGAEQLAPAVAAVKAPDAPLVSGEHCRFCPALAHCPEVRRAAKERVMHLFTDESLERPLKVPASPAALSPAELAVAMRAFPTVERWMKAVREYAYAQAAGGVLLPGFKLVQKEGNRKWRNEVDAALMLESHMPDGVTPFSEPKLLSPAQAEKLLPKDVRKIVAALTMNPVTGTVLVPADDERPAVSRGDVFPLEDAPTTE